MLYDGRGTATRCWSKFNMRFATTSRLRPIPSCFLGYSSSGKYSVTRSLLTELPDRHDQIAVGHGRNSALYPRYASITQRIDPKRQNASDLAPLSSKNIPAHALHRHPPTAHIQYRD